MQKTNKGLVEYAKAQIGKPYWYGTYGQTANKNLYLSKKKQYPSYYKATDYESQYGNRVHDCVGLIKGYIWSADPTAKPRYKSSEDKSASGMYAAAKIKGAISLFPKTEGLLVFKGKTEKSITHVGIYDGNGYVYEAKGHAEGVVKTKYKSGSWSYWAECPYITYVVDNSGTVTNNKATAEQDIEYAASRESGYAKGKTLTTTAPLNMRKGAGTSKDIITVLPKETKVTWYGYYTTVNNVKWYLVQANGYTGYCSSKYLAYNI